MVDCKDCKHFAERPGDTTWKRKTGCYHPERMAQTQDDGFLSEQEVPGDHTQINADGSCTTFEAAPPKPTLIARFVRAMRD